MLYAVCCTLDDHNDDALSVEGKEGLDTFHEVCFYRWPSRKRSRQLSLQKVSSCRRGVFMLVL
jgi:hypothetical protein